MTELKVFVSPHFSEEEFEDTVSGLIFKKGRSINVHSIDIAENKLSGIQSALRKTSYFLMINKHLNSLMVKTLLRTKKWLNQK